jgi:WD40 repeat protein
MILRATGLLGLLFSFLIAVAQTEPRLVLPIGHTSSVNSAVFSPDGIYALTASWDNTARIYEVSTGKEVHVLLGHKNYVTSAGFSPDGKYALTASWDNARIYDVLSGKELQVLTGHIDGLHTAVYSPDGKYVLTASRDKTARIFDALSGKELLVLTGHTDWVNTAIFSPDGKYALTASRDKTVRIFDVSSGKELRVFSGYKRQVSFARYSPDGKYVLTASDDKTVRIFELTSGKEVHVLSGHTSWLNSAVFSPDGKYALTASDDYTARIYDVSSGKELQVLRGHKNSVWSAVFSPDGKYALTASGDGTAHIWDVARGKELHVLSGHTSSVNSAVFSPDGKYVLTASGDKTARIWEVSSGQEVHVLSGHTEYVRSAVFSPDGNFILTASEDNKARIYEVAIGKEVHSLSGHTGIIKSAVFSPNGKHALTASYDETARIWDVSSGKELQVLSGHTGSVNSAVFSPDGKYVLCRSGYTARIFEVSTGKEVHTLAGHTDYVYSAVFSPDGKYALTAGRDRTVRIFEVSSGKEVHVFSGHKRQVNSARYSPDGKYVLTASDDKTARIYEASSGKKVHVLSGHKAVNEAVFSPDGKYALTAGRDRTVRIFEVSSGEELQALQVLSGYSYTYTINSALFSPDGKYFIIAIRNMFADGDENTARIYEVPSGKELHVLSELTSSVSSAVFSPDGKYILTTSADHKTILWETATGKALYTRLQLKDNDWLVYDEHYRFDGTPGAIEKLYFVCGLEIVELNQFRKLLYVPHLVERILNGENLDHIAKLSQLQVCDHIPLVTPVDDNIKKYRFEITPRLSGVGDIEIYINGIKRGETIDANDLQLVNGRYYIEVDSLLIQEFTSPGEPAKIEVIAKTANNDINSRPAQMNTRSVQVSIAGQKENKLRKPELYAVLIGVDDYRDDALDLKFASKDAIDFHRAFQLAAEKYFNTDDTNRVHIFNLTIDRNGNTGSEKLNGMTPDKGTILRQLDEIEKKSKPADVILFFFAGHGKIVSNNELLLLTTESQAIEPIGVGIDELFERFSKIKASKRILILDACHAGVAINQLNQFGLIGMRADDDVATRSMHEKELDKLASKEGFSILTACSSSQEAQELPQYEHGLMTFALLNSMLNNPKSLTETGELNLGQWFSQVEEEIKRLNIPDQDVQVSLPVVFNIGKVDEEVRTTIQLKELPTVFIESVMNMKMMRDNLELKKRLNTCLQNTLRGEHTSVLVADSPQATRVNIGYEEQVENVKVNVLVYKGAIERSFEFNGSKAAMDHLANEIIARVLQELENE